MNKNMIVKYLRDLFINYYKNLIINKPQLNTLHFASFLYLGVPLILYFVSWLKWYYSFPIISLVILTLPNFQIQLNLISIKKFGMYFFTLGLFLLIIGYGEADDWTKHNAIFYELFNSWNKPVILNYEGKKYILSYGLGFYIIPSYIAGFLKSFSIIKWLIFVNSVLGLSLIGLWLSRLFNIPLWGIFFVFLLGRFEWLYGLLFYLENFTHSQIVAYVSFNYIPFAIEQLPQHFIPIILVFLIVYDQIRLYVFNPIFLSYVILFGLFWSPFLPFAVFPLVFLLRSNHFVANCNWKIILKLLPLVIIGASLIYYYLLHISVPQFKLTYESIGIKQLILLLLTQYLLLYFIYIFIVFYANYKLKFMNWFQVKMVIFILIMSIFYKQFNYGYYNDFEIKTTFLIAFVINIYMFKSLEIFTIKKYAIFKFSIGIIIIASFFSSTFFCYLQISPLTYREVFSKLTYNLLTIDMKKKGLKDALHKKSIDQNYPFFQQYLGDQNDVVEKVIKNEPR